MFNLVSILIIFSLNATSHAQTQEAKDVIRDQQMEVLSKMKVTKKDWDTEKDELIQNCNHNQETLAACTMTVNQAVNNQGIIILPPNMPTPSTWKRIGSTPEQEKLANKLSGIPGQYITFQTNENATFLELSEATNSTHQAWIRHYIIHSNDKIDFGSIFNLLKKEKNIKNALSSQFIVNTFRQWQYSDPHLQILSAPQLYSFLTDFSEPQTSYKIGADLQYNDQGLFISKIMPDSPAEKSNLKEGDLIQNIIITKGKKPNFTHADSKITKLAKTIYSPFKNAVLEVLRDGEVLNIPVYKAPITTNEQVTSKISSNLEHTAVIKLESFMDPDACSLLAKTLQEHRSQGAQKYILDLRDNPGGLLDQATCIAGLFLGKGRHIVTQKTLLSLYKYLPPSDYIKSYYSNPPTDFETITDDLVVLVNEMSASASEILAGILQYYKRAHIVGQKTYGKGCIQNTYPASEDLKFWQIRTSAYYVFPDGYTLQQRGITPDFVMPAHYDDLFTDKYIRSERALIPASLPETGAERIVQKTTDQIMLNYCIKTSSNIVQEYEDSKKETFRTDVQLRYAEELLKCMAE